MNIDRGETLSGFVISVTDGDKTLNLYSADSTFSDSNGEIIVDGIPEYNIETLTDVEAFEMFVYASNYFDGIKALMSQMETE